MSLTSIGDQRTPGRPVEIFFEAETGSPSDAQELLLFGRLDTVSGSVPVNTVEAIENVADLDAASGEVATKFGLGSEIAKMVLAAVKANESNGTFPAMKVVALENGATEFGTAALAAAKNVKAEFIVSPFPGGSDTANRETIEDFAQTLSGAQRVHNNQFGSIAVAAEFAVAIGSLPQPDSQFFAGMYFRDSAPTRLVGEVAAACAARMASNLAPFLPLDDVTIEGIDAPVNEDDHITVGAGLESESILTKGWTPLRVKPNGDVSFVRTVTSRRSADGSGSPIVEAYYDVQDFQVLYYWRKAVYTRASQPDFKIAKASIEIAKRLKAELIRMAKDFEAEGMFQAVDQLAKEFVVERSNTDRHRFDVLTPVNVIPGLHVIATRISATTRFDTLSV